MGRISKADIEAIKKSTKSIEKLAKQFNRHPDVIRKYKAEDGAVQSESESIATIDANKSVEKPAYDGPPRVTDLMGRASHPHKEEVPVATVMTQAASELADETRKKPKKTNVAHVHKPFGNNPPKVKKK